jgi:hypothetical protein
MLISSTWSTMACAWVNVASRFSRLQLALLNDNLLAGQETNIACSSQAYRWHGHEQAVALRM